MITKAYFVNPSGKILDIGSTRHIRIIAQNPEKFGFTREEVQAFYDEHGGRMGQEGPAREAVIHEIIRRGFIHIRQYRNFWAINVNVLDSKTKQTLVKWAEHIIDNKIDRHGQTRIYSLRQDAIVANPTIQDIYYEMYEENNKMDKFQPMIVESIEEFEDLVMDGDFIMGLLKEELLSESSLSRVWDKMNKYDYGTITAFRAARDCGDGVPYTHKENMQRNKSLVSALLSKGYSVTAIKGAYIEGWKTDKEIERVENSYFVTDTSGRGMLEKDLRSQGERFEQDSIIFGKAGEPPEMIGTNRCPSFPGYGKRSPFKGTIFGKNPTTSPFLSRVRDRPFIYKESVDLPKPKYPTEFIKWAQWAKEDWKNIKIFEQEEKWL